MRQEDVETSPRKYDSFSLGYEQSLFNNNKRKQQQKDQYLASTKTYNRTREKVEVIIGHSLEDGNTHKVICSYIYHAS